MIDNNHNGSNVLIVDDLEINLRLLSEILSKNNIKVTSANNGKKAIELAHLIKPDLILLDIAMPEKDGFQVCEELKNFENTKNIPIIFLTAKGQTEDVVKGLKLGAVDYLTKPFKTKELVSRINTHLDLKKAKDIIDKQNIELSQNNLQLTKSLHYARHIQEKLLPKDDLLKQYLDDFFIIHLPKHIVSGDFYWSTKQNNLIFLAVIDYTGHGMPGALVSMIGNTLLNEIIIKNEIHNPSQILHELNEEIIKTLNSGKDFSDFDNEGMDISLCVIDKEKKEVKVSCANQDVYYVKNNQLKKIESQIISIGSKFSEKNNIDFVTHIVDISVPTNFYLFTDGYQDQFGGPSNKKYQINNLEDILIENSPLPFNDQKNILTNQLNFWKDKNEQTDDILLIGFKVEI
jgi:DNA-binding response OmpR family regulator